MPWGVFIRRGTLSWFISITSSPYHSIPYRDSQRLAVCPRSHRVCVMTSGVHRVKPLVLCWQCCQKRWRSEPSVAYVPGHLCCWNGIPTLHTREKQVSHYSWMVEMQTGRSGEAGQTVWVKWEDRMRGGKRAEKIMWDPRKWRAMAGNHIMAPRNVGRFQTKEKTEQTLTQEEKHLLRIQKLLF